MEKRSIKNLFYNPAWCIACRKINPDNGLFPDLNQEPFSVLLPTNTEWYADPMCFSDNGKTYIFVELMYCNNPSNANIGVTEFKNGKFSAVKEIISEPFHMSYPNVFRYGEHYYMIPETSAANQVRLYESVDFPYQWKLKKILLDEVRLVDSSFMKIDDRRLLFFSHDTNNKKSPLRMFILDQDKLTFKEMDRFPEASDERPGGNIIMQNGEEYRVLQDCSEEYGKKLKLYHITDINIEQMRYSEEYSGEITIDTIPLNADRGFAKVHTYTRSGDYEVIDTLYNRFYINHPFRRFKYLFMKKPSYEFGGKPKLLYVVGQCLYNNTSANMSHNAFVKGFIENGYDVDIVMPEDSWGAPDSKLGKLEASYHTYKYYSFADRVRIKYFSRAGSEKVTTDSGENQAHEEVQQKKGSLRDIVKKHFYRLSRGDSRYGNETYWLKKAVKYSSDSLYDLVVSNSSPEASHKLVIDLLKKKHIKCKRWVQIWEDPWYYDLYGGHLESDREEEHQLLKSANEIYYVSPLTLMYQKQHYSDCAHKMKCVPLPFLEYSNKTGNGDVVKDSFGYFGDYYSYTRNLKPFYEALLQSGYSGHIFGDTDLALKANDKIEISGRVTLDVLEKVQDKTEVLVHLSNLKGGQIPGKIFHYSATDKPILFILDGTKEEIVALREFFGKYDRYYFCENNKEQILLTMKRIITEDRRFEPVNDFKPENVVKKIIISD